MDRVEHEAYLTVNTHKDNALSFFDWIVLAVRARATRRIDDPTAR